MSNRNQNHNGNQNRNHNGNSNGNQNPNDKKNKVLSVLKSIGTTFLKSIGIILKGILQFKIAKVSFGVWLVLLVGLILTRELTSVFCLYASFILLIIAAIALMCKNTKGVKNLAIYATIFMIAYSILSRI